MDHVVAEGLQVAPAAVGPGVGVPACVLQRAVVRLPLVRLLRPVEPKGVPVAARQAEVHQVHRLPALLLQAHQQVLGLDVVVGVAEGVDEPEGLEDHGGHPQHRGEGDRGGAALEPFVQVTGGIRGKFVQPTRWLTCQGGR